MYALLVLLASATTAQANPVSCEKAGSITLAEDGKHALVQVLNSCEGPDDFAEYYAVQVNKGGWKTLHGDWAEVDTAEANGGSGMETYTVYENEVACPGQGSYDFRVAFVFDDETESWFSDTVECEGRGGCSAVPVGAGLGALLLSLGLVATRRRS